MPQSSHRIRRARSLAVWFWVGLGVMLLPLFNVAAAALNAQAAIGRNFDAAEEQSARVTLPIVELQSQVLAVPAREAVRNEGAYSRANLDRATEEIGATFLGLRGAAAAGQRTWLTMAEEDWNRADAALEELLDREGRVPREEIEAELETFLFYQRRTATELRLAAQSSLADQQRLTTAADASRREALTAIAVSVIGGLIVAGLAARSLARHVLTPITALERAAVRLGEGELSHRVEVRRRDELGALAAAFNKMAADLERSRDQLTHQALHDPLTELANRTLLADRVEHALAGARRRGTSVALLLLDLDGFKTVNDSLGHPVGDRLLAVTAQRIRSGLRAGDTAARLGGDEFAVLLEDIEADLAIEVADRLGAALREPVLLDGAEVALGASIGIALSGGVDTGDELLRNADLAMYRAKQGGRGRHELFEAGMHVAAVARMNLEGELRRALDRGEFRLVYQPIVDLLTGSVSGCEALIRWRHPERGAIPPSDFIPLAEETGLVVPLGRWVLNEVCRQAAAWHRAHPGLAGLVVGANLSVRQLQHPDLLAHVRAALDASGVDPTLIILELTESAIMDDGEAALRRLRGLHDFGVSLALDDFGTGYSSLSYLQTFPIQVLKLDKSFVDPLDRQGQGAVLAGAVVNLGTALGLRTVAEGIEHAEQAEVLTELGCHFGQGYHFGRPMGPDQLAARVLEALRSTV
jgi:diguanylate cyclase (GGDEF)-like protein